jgi:hypothetical protein
MREAEASATLARDGAAEDATVDAAEDATEDAAGAESAGDERDPHVD